MRKARPTLTESAARLPREDLALMATVAAGLGPWERTAMLPMLGDDFEAMRHWLLAGAREFGVGPEAKRRRAALRAKAWSDLAFAWDAGGALEGRRWPAWTPNGWGRAASAARFFMPTHWGVPSGRRDDYPFHSGLAPYILTLMAAGFAYVCWLASGSLAGSFPEPGRGLGLAAGATVAIRLVFWGAIGPVGRSLAAAQAAMPRAARMWMELLARREEAREELRWSQRRAAPDGEDVRQALLRAALGEGPTSAELVAQSAQERDLARAAEELGRAMDPAIVFSRSELADLERASAGAAAPSAPRRTRL